MLYLTYLSVKAGIEFHATSIDVARESGHTLVHLHVFVKVCSLGKGLSTAWDVAAEGAFASVDP